MKRRRRTVLLILSAAIFLLSVSACGSTFLYRAIEVVDQTYRANAQGTYLGTSSSYEGAGRLAASKGYRRFEWYSSTGDVWGFND